MLNTEKNNKKELTVKVSSVIDLLKERLSRLALARRFILISESAVEPARGVGLLRVNEVDRAVGVDE